MASIGRGGVAQLRMAVESALGTPGSYHCLRIDDIPDFPSTRQLIEGQIKGFMHPSTLAKGEPISKCIEDAFSIDMRIRRATTDGGVPDLISILKSAGLKAETSSGATTLTGTPTTSSLVQTANVTGAGQYVLVERASGVHVPVLVSALATATITPHVRLASAPSTGADVNPMTTITPTAHASTGYKVPSDQTLAFILNSQGFGTSVIGDLALMLKGCALSKVGELSFGGVGTIPKFPCSFHGIPVDYTADVIAADAFTDNDHFAFITDDLEFSIQDASASGAIALVTRSILEAKIDLGFKVLPIYATGSGTVGGISGYFLYIGNPTLKIKYQFSGSSADADAFHELEGSNTSVCAQLIQPTRDLEHPAFAFCIPNAHITAGQEPKLDIKGDIITADVSYTGSTGGIATTAGDEIDEVLASPWYFAISGEPAA